ncbi:sigma-70 RNA polymerase sigma factor region 4 domain-containing protein [Aeromicrobium terrae]|nr:sigma-70 family RNA polymerase sigma factor [Aeromicrobium terrae]
MEAVLETAHDYLVDSTNYAGLTEIAARVEDEPGLRNYLTAALTNYLRAAGRRTTMGRLVRRLRDRLSEDDRFAWVPAGSPGAGNVMLSGQSSVPYGGPLAELAEAAAAVEVNVVRWRSSSKREGPLADTPALMAMSQAMLRKAQGSLSVPQLAEVMSRRLGVDPRSIPATIPVEDLGENLAVDMERHSSGRFDAHNLEVADALEVIFDELTEREILVLSALHEPIRIIADQTGMPVSTVGAVKQRVQLKLSTILREYHEADAETIAFAARDTARQHLGLDPV